MAWPRAGATFEHGKDQGDVSNRSRAWLCWSNAGHAHPFWGAQFTYGASQTLTPLERSSAPMAAPYCSARATSHVAASVKADGKHVTLAIFAATPLAPSCVGDDKGLVRGQLLTQRTPSGKQACRLTKVYQTPQVELRVHVTHLQAERRDPDSWHAWNVALVRTVPMAVPAWCHAGACARAHGATREHARARVCSFVFLLACLCACCGQIEGAREAA